jgi:hypothetical protein
LKEEHRWAEKNLLSRVGPLPFSFTYNHQGPPP